MPTSREDVKGLVPLNILVSALLTDMYQITMSYAYWKAGRHNENAVFDLFFRKCPFKGQFAIFAGLSEVIALMNSFTFSPSDIAYLRTVLPHCEEAFFDWLGQLDCRNVRLYALEEGSLCFPRIPLIRVEGPLAVAQLLETPLLNLINYPSLIATNAARLRLAAGADKTLLEFGLRRAQIKDPTLDGKDFVAIVKGYRDRPVCGKTSGSSNDGELAAFTAYAQAFPDGFVALVDTYDTLQSGVPNFLCVALALDDLGHRALGCRLDSGDLSYLSQEVRKMTTEAAKTFNRQFLATTNIVASNDINEESLHYLADQGHAIDTFGIGTNLVTCQAQPALGCVYKLVSIEGVPRIKLSQTTSKITIPGRKAVYRLLGADRVPILDIMLKDGEEPPQPGVPILARHPFVATKRARVTPTQVVRLQEMVWDGQAGGATSDMPTIHEVRATVAKGLKEIRQDTLQRLNPTPYKVCRTY
ncbi:unnamed protein product [Ectocarpus sp. 8 AP-2014]